MSKFTHEEIEEMLPYVLMGKSKIGVANQIIRQLLDDYRETVKVLRDVQKNRLQLEVELKNLQAQQQDNVFIDALKQSSATIERLCDDLLDLRECLESYQRMHEAGTLPNRFVYLRAQEMLNKIKGERCNER